MKEDTIYTWGDSRRFNSYSQYIKNRFGGRVQKLTINAGFTCPNRDGKVGTGGCTFCNNSAFNPSYCNSDKSILEQVQEGIDFHRTRYKSATRFLAYFQSFSNTYAPVELLKSVYYEALSHPDIVGLVIGTRPDCIDEPILDLIAKINESAFVTVEYGIESCYNTSLLKINRGHDFETVRSALESTSKRGIRTGGHIIIGLPGESRQMILEEAGILSGLPVNHLKFHQLQIVKGTTMATDYKMNPHHYTKFELDDYLQLMAEFIARLSPDILIERIAGETVIDYNLREDWGLRNDQILVGFEKKLQVLDLWQGKYWKK